MTRLFIAFLLSLCAASASAQNQTFSNYINSLTATTSAGGADKLYILQGGTSKSIGVGGLGISANILNTVIANYTIATSDCGKTIQAGTGVTGLFNIILPVVTGFPTNCVVSVVNGDNGRGKALSGFPSDVNPILWPGQTLQVSIINGIWKTTTNPGRWRLTANTSFFIDGSLGSDSNDGLASGAGGAMLSMMAFNNIVTKQLDTQNVIVTLSFAAGQTWNNLVLNVNTVGGGTVSLLGNGGTLNSSVSNTAALQVFAPTNGVFANVGGVVQGFTVTCSGGGNGILLSSGFLEIFQNMTFGSCAGGYHIGSDSMLSRVILGANYTISGGAAEHFAAIAGLIDFNSSAFTITLTGTPAFSTAFALSEIGGNLISFAIYSGAATGVRYSATTGGQIFTNNGSACGAATYFPGNSSGTTSGGGLCN
jgi:hypothetical protein